MFARRKQRTTLLQDVGRAASRIAGESRGLAEVARNELGSLSREVRQQASGTATHARRATARRLAGAADAVEPARKKRRRRVPILLSAVAGGLAAVKFARTRSRVGIEEPGPAEEPSPGSKRTASPPSRQKAVTEKPPVTTAASTGNRSSS
jgi:hypothetical protein